MCNMLMLFFKDYPDINEDEEKPEKQAIPFCE
jgi:hypothetical protein